MKLSTFLKNATALFAVLFSVINVQALNVINVPAAGQLSTVLTQAQRDTITRLKLTGFLDSNTAATGDFGVLRTMPNLYYLDISEVAVTNNAIPNNAFNGKANLKTAILPSAITSIGSYAFYNCSSLSDFVFPENLATITNECAFQGCTSFTTLRFPASLRTIGNYAFRYCRGLTNVQFNEGLQVIGANAFYDCSQLAGQLLLPSTITQIQNDAFSYCRQLRWCKSLAETPPAVGNAASLGNIVTVYVPENAVSGYQAANIWRDKILIAGDQPRTLTLNITSPGTLGVRALEQFGYLREINVLNLSGTLNSTDFSIIREMVSLISADLSGLTNTELYDNLFNGRTGLLNVKLPSNLKRINAACFQNCYALELPDFPASLEGIGSNAFNTCLNVLTLDPPASLKYIDSDAFRNCYNLKTVHFPNGLLTIGSNAFNSCTSISEIVIPESITPYLGGGSFNGCSSLSSVSLPDNMTTIHEYTFANCTSLAGIQLPSKLTRLGRQAFGNCTGLTRITLPAGLDIFFLYYSSGNEYDGHYDDYAPFRNCTSIRQVLCLQATPPVLSADPFSGVPKATCELLVPVWAETDYKLANVWKNFTTINPHNEDISNIVLTRPLTITGNARPNGLPSVEITQTGSLIVKGNTPFNTNEFILMPALRYVYRSAWSSYARFISECNNMTAQKAKIDMSAYGNRWYYLSFPFDVAISAITIDEDAHFVFRRYDGQSRAAQGVGNSWKTLNPGDTLRSGVGYIFQCNKDVSHIVLPATNESKNKLFQSTAKAFALNEYTSATAANSNWNLMGNPYPSYFDVQFLDFTAPITYWNDNNSRYDAISPIDDLFPLQPYQAFFVQKPSDLAVITFQPEGRQTTSEIVQRAPAFRASADRVLINLEINNAEYSDKTRVVINPEARSDYELTCDASKFMSTELQAPQLYSLDASATQYAINERPLDDGIVPLGFYAGAADLFDISLKNTVDAFSIILYDKYLDISTDLAVTDYSFHSEAGTFDDRFDLRIAGNVTGKIGIDQPATKVYASDRNIIVETDTAGKTVSVFTIAGVKAVETTTTNGSISIPAIRGAYIVKIDNAVFKVVVF